MDIAYGLKRLARACAVVIVCVLTNYACADCDSTAKTHYPTYNQANYEGSAHTDSFECAINGSKQLSMEQINERLDFMPPKLTNRYYFRLGVNAAAEGLTNASNKEPNNTTTLITGSVQTPSNKIASNTFELALGYAWSEFAMDLEWLSPSSIDLTTVITGVTPTFTLYSNVKGDALLLNLYWILQDLYNFKLYGDFILGYSDNSNTSYIDTGDETHTKWKHAAFGLGVGARFNLVSRLYADVKGRYIRLGTTRLVADNGVNHTYIKANRTWLGASVCLLWLF